jgi:septal ring factor EnvC (AmiA/AmiB activator)
VGAVSARKQLAGLCTAALLCGLVVVLAIVPGAGAADAGSLEGKLAAAREQASSVAASLQASTEQLAVAQTEAAAAQTREERLSVLLAEGEERTVELTGDLRRTRHRLAVEKARLRRSRAALAERLVAIYESGATDTASFVLGAGDYQEFVTRSDYLRAISEADSALADRVEQVRKAVDREVDAVAGLRSRAVEHEERLADAHSEIASAREAAEASASHLAGIAASRQASLDSLKSDISRWVAEVQAARAAEARAATLAEAEEEVGRWLGGPYSIPTYIVMCESGGNYSALNPSSGAGGAYQILPSTWELYGGQGAPHEASKEEQDRIAAEIWADSGGGAWVCA